MKGPKRRIALLGSTGSIGTQALDIIRDHREEFEATLLVARSSVDLLIAQAREFHPRAVVIADESLYTSVHEALSPLGIEVYAGSTAIEEAVQHPDIDIVLTAMVGYAGLRPTMAAIRAGKTIALANKETLVVAGDLIIREAKAHQARRLGALGYLPVSRRRRYRHRVLSREDPTNGLWWPLPWL